MWLLVGLQNFWRDYLWDSQMISVTNPTKVWHWWDPSISLKITPLNSWMIAFLRSHRFNSTHTIKSQKIQLLTSYTLLLGLNVNNTILKLSLKNKTFILNNQSINDTNISIETHTFNSTKIQCSFVFFWHKIVLILYTIPLKHMKIGYSL